MSAVVAAFVAGITAWIFLTNQIESKAHDAVSELKNKGDLPKGEKGDQGLAGPPGPSLPVGSVVAFWGTLEEIPDDYELCDGELVKKTNSKLHGHKPDLRDTFLKGAQADTLDVRSKPVYGGSHTKDFTHTHAAGNYWAKIGPHEDGAACWKF